MPAVAATGWLGVAPIPGPVGFGIALAAGLLADQAAVGLWDVAFDPHGRLIRVTNARLDALHALVREGSATTPGLRPALERLAAGSRCRPPPGRAARAGEGRCPLRMFLRCPVLVVLLALVSSGWSSAGVLPRVARAVRALGREAAQAGPDVVSRPIAPLAARPGAGAVTTLRRGGPDVIREIDPSVATRLLVRHGPDATALARNPRQRALVAPHGEAAARVLLRHGRLAEPLLVAHGRPTARALASLSSRNARRLAILDETGDLAKIGRTDAVLALVGRQGDRAMDFVWHHKGALAVGVVLTAFLADPGPFLDGTRDLAEATVTAAVPPVAEVPGQLAQAAFRRLDCGTVGRCLLALTAALAWISILGRRGRCAFRRWRPGHAPTTPPSAESVP